MTDTLFKPVLPPIILEPTHRNGKVTTVPADYSVIWLHGLGADGHDFESIVPQLGLPQSLRIRFVFPTAPVRPVTVNLGADMTAWYDIKSLNLLDAVDWDGIDASTAYVQSLIEAEQAKGVSSERILLAGFSQGGVIALQAAMQCAEALAGLMVLSSYFPVPPASAMVQSRDLPVMLAHGTEDPICPLRNAQQAKTDLISLGFDPQWHEYRMQHQVCADEIGHMTHFILQCFSND